MTSIDELRTILQKDNGGSNLYDHLTEVLLKIVVEKPSDPYVTFEELSAEVKCRNGSVPKHPTIPCQEQVSMTADGACSVLHSWCRQIDNQLRWTTECSKLLKVTLKIVVTFTSVDNTRGTRC